MTITQKETKIYREHLRSVGVEIIKIENGVYKASLKGVEVLVSKLDGQPSNQCWESTGSDELFSNKINAIYWTMRTSLDLF